MKKVTKLPQPNDFSCDMYNTGEDYSTEKIAWKKSNIELLVTKVATIIFVRNILAFILNSKRKRSNSAKFSLHSSLYLSVR